METLIDGDLSAQQQASLEDIVRCDPAARRWFLDEMQFHAALKWDCIESTEPSSETTPDVAQFPTISLLGEASPNPIASSFFSGWATAYLIATVLLAIGLTVAALIHVSQPTSIVLPSPASGGHHEVVGAGGEGGQHSLSSSIVASITGMVDCVLNNDECRMPNAELHTKTTDIHRSSISNPKSPIRLGDRLALRSGLLEITYNTGAKVILQGPVTYEVESSSGGYLSGWQTHRQVGEEVRSQRSEVSVGKSEIGNQKSESPLTSVL